MLFLDSFWLHASLRRLSLSFGIRLPQIAATRLRRDICVNELYQQDVTSLSNAWSVCTEGNLNANRCRHNAVRSNKATILPKKLKESSIVVIEPFPNGTDVKCKNVDILQRRENGLIWCGFEVSFPEIRELKHNKRRKLKRITLAWNILSGLTVAGKCGNVYSYSLRISFDWPTDKLCNPTLAVC